jgi:hypothetical protein
MATYREYISEIIKDARLLYVDQYVPNGYIYHKLISKARSIIKRDSDNRRLFSQSHIFHTINRFWLEPDETNFFGVGNYDHDRFFMKSKVPLPEAFTTYTGLAVIINTIQPSNKQFVEISFDRYREVMIREYRDRRMIYYWWQDRYLVLPDVHYRAVRIDGLFINPLEIKLINGTMSDCDRLLDQPFCCPEYLMDDVRNAVVIDVLKEYSAARPDDVPDMNESNKVAAQPA